MNRKPCQDLPAKLTPHLQESGARGRARRIVETLLQELRSQVSRTPPEEVLGSAILSLRPLVRVHRRTLGGESYPVPERVPQTQADRSAFRTLIRNAKARGGRTLARKLAGEILTLWRRMEPTPVPPAPRPPGRRSGRLSVKGHYGSA